MEKTEPFSAFMRHEESGAQLDQGTDAAQVRRSAPTEPTCTENVLRVRCSREKRRVKCRIGRVSAG